MAPGSERPSPARLKGGGQKQPGVGGTQGPREQRADVSSHETHTQEEEVAGRMVTVSGWAWCVLLLVTGTGVSRGKSWALLTVVLQSLKSVE